LCTLTKADFWVCAGSKRGGDLLAKHFAHLIHSATGRTQSSLLNDDDPGKLFINKLSLIEFLLLLHNKQINLVFSLLKSI